MAYGGQNPGMLPARLRVSSVVSMLALGTLMNGITRSRIERALWLPTTVLLLVATPTVALTA